MACGTKNLHDFLQHSTQKTQHSLMGFTQARSRQQQAKPTQAEHFHTWSRYSFKRIYFFRPQRGPPPCLLENGGGRAGLMLMGNNRDGARNLIVMRPDSFLKASHIDHFFSFPTLCEAALHQI